MALCVISVPTAIPTTMFALQRVADYDQRTLRYREISSAWLVACSFRHAQFYSD